MHSGTWALGGHSEGTRRALGHLENTGGHLENAFTWKDTRALGHIRHVGTQTLKALRHLGTYGTQALGDSRHLGTWALETLYLADSYIRTIDQEGQLYILVITIHKQKLYRPARSSYQRCSFKKGALRNLSKFTGTHLCQRLFLKRVSDTGAFL